MFNPSHARRQIVRPEVQRDTMLSFIVDWIGRSWGAVETVEVVAHGTFESLALTRSQHLSANHP